MLEKDLYKPVQRWLRKRGYKVEARWKNVGVADYRVDVVGIRNSGNKFYDDIEIVTVEAKVAGGYKSLGEAENYKDFSHKVYFATTAPEGLEEYIGRRNLGLLKIDKSTKKVREIISAVPARPRNEAQMIEILHKLGILKCTLCNCYYGWKHNKERLKRAPKFTIGKPIVHRYLCPECLNYLHK